MENCKELQLASQPHLIWADAVCIYQSNNEEKGIQVQMMRIIGPMATTVIVWPSSSNYSLEIVVEKP